MVIQSYFTSRRMNYPCNMVNKVNIHVILVLIVRSHLENIVFRGFLIPGQIKRMHQQRCRNGIVVFTAG